MDLEEPALARLKVLDTTSDVAGQFCGRLFADYGAEVILAEPFGGTPTRFAWPLEAGQPVGEASLLFRHLNQGKRGQTLPEAAEAAARTLAELVAGADIVLIDGRRSDLKALVDDERQIVCTISDFGETGPYRDWRGAEIVHQALSGVMFVTGSQDREPLLDFHRLQYTLETGRLTTP